MLVNGIAAQKADQKITRGDVITFFDSEIKVKEHVYLILNKPKGYVCSEIDEGGHLSYKHLITNYPHHKLVHVAGRLDQDTE